MKQKRNVQPRHVDGLRLHRVAAILAGPAAGGTAAVIGLLYFSTGFGHG